MADLNPRLRTYERDLEKHLRSVLLQLEDQTRKTERSLRTAKTENDNVHRDEPTLRRDIKRLQKEFDTNAKKNDELEYKAENDQVAKAKVAEKLAQCHEDLQTEIQKEKELRFNLDDLNHQINVVQNQLDSIAWPEKNDMKLLKGMVSKAKNDVTSMEKEKRIQDAYVERLRKDVEIAENELEQLAVTAKHLKAEREVEKDDFFRLRDKLETYKSGTIRLEDHFGKLMKNLQDNRNKVQLIDHRKRELERHVRGAKNDELMTLASKRSLELHRRISRLASIREKQEARILKRTATNHHLRTAVNQQKQKSMPLAERDLEEARAQNKSLKRKCELIEREHDEVRSQKGTYLRPQDVHTISAQFEQLEKDLFFNEFKLNTYEKIDEELEDLLKRRSESDKLAASNPNLSNSLAPPQPSSSMRRSKSATGDDGSWPRHKKYSDIRDSITELVRKKIALEYKKKRMEEKILHQEAEYGRAKKLSEALYKEQEAVEKSHEERRLARVPVVENEQLDESDPEFLLLKRIEFSEGRVRDLQTEEKNLRLLVDEQRRACDEYRNKIGDFEAVQSLSDEHAEQLNEIHKLQKKHQGLEKQLWKVQKELEYTVMRRDYAVNRARTVLGTHNEIRAQRDQSLSRLRSEINDLEKEIAVSGQAVAAIGF